MATWQGDTITVNCYHCRSPIEDDLSHIEINWVDYLWCADCRGGDRVGARPPKGGD